MTKIKFCGLTRLCDIRIVNELSPEYIGFIFAPESRRYIPPCKAAELKAALHPDIMAAGVFVNEAAETVAGFLDSGVIDIAQLHGREDEEYIQRLRKLTDKPLIQAFRIRTESDIANAEVSSADYVLLDSGAGTGKAFDWRLIRNFKRPFFLAGGLDPDNVGEAVRQLHPYGVDVSSGIETDRVKDKHKMTAFSAAVRKGDKNDEH